MLIEYGLCTCEFSNLDGYKDIPDSGELLPMLSLTCLKLIVFQKSLTFPKRGLKDDLCDNYSKPLEYLSSLEISRVLLS